MWAKQMHQNVISISDVLPVIFSLLQCLTLFIHCLSLVFCLTESRQRCLQICEATDREQLGRR